MGQGSENPPAFPSGHMLTPEGGVELHPGMTLRDWFAGQALAGMYANPHIGKIGGDADAVRGAYGIADAMLAARAGAETPVEPQMRHVAYVSDGEFHWMSGIKPRDCELYAARSGEVA